MLPGCAIKYYYTPGVYEIAEGRVTPIGRVGTLEVVANQDPDPERNYVFYDQTGAVWRTDRAMIAKAIAEQLAGQIEIYGGRVTLPADHTLAISVSRVHAAVGWTVNVELSVEVSLDGAPARVFVVENKSPGNMWRAMNGTIAIAVIEILNDADVRKWLAETQQAK